MFKQNIKEDSKSREWAMDTSVPRSYSGTITGYGGHASGDYAMDLDAGSWYVFLQYRSALSPDQ